MVITRAKEVVVESPIEDEVEISEVEARPLSRPSSQESFCEDFQEFQLNTDTD